MDAVGEQRFDVVVDPVGGQVRTDSLGAMAPSGRMLLVGNAGGDRRVENGSVGGRILLTP
jgi:NADPH2:quinone reductase